MRVAEEMRREFDRSFSEPERSVTSRSVRLLAIRANARLLAVRVEQMGGLIRTPKLTELPSDATGLLGIAGARGKIAGFYSIAALAADDHPTGGAWALLTGPEGSIALVFDELDGSFDVAPEELREIVRFDGRAHALIDLERIAREITARGK
jgi:purine-binding chemotaxis protein CheW